MATSSLLALVFKFWVWDLTVMPPGFRQPEFEQAAATKLRDGQDSVRIWVERGLGAHQPHDEAIKAIVELLAEKTPVGSLDPSQGIVDLERRYFGTQPNPPSGERDIQVVIASLPPYQKNGKKYGFDGFFNVYDQLSELVAQNEGQHSNERNIIYVNALQDLSSDYMRAVVAHELNHMLTYGSELEGWENEMLGEAAMQMTGYFTDTHHVQAYRAKPEWPLAVSGYGITYGGLSLFAEYLMNHFDPALMGKIARAKGNAFERLETAYGKPWAELFEGYAQWLYEQTPPSRFAAGDVAAREIGTGLNLAPTGIAYLKEAAKQTSLRITAVPKACAASENMIHTKFVQRGGASATAIWIQSTPPCEAEKKDDGFQIEATEIDGPSAKSAS